MATGRTPGSKNSCFHKWTSEEKAYLTEIVSSRSHVEICRMMRDRFDIDLTDSQIKGAIARYGLHTGRSGCFEKGHVPWTKGKKGYHAPGAEKGWFKKGGYAHNRVPIGTERISKDGYIEVKYRDGHGVRNWRSKQSHVWEEVNGRPIPDGHCVMLRDGDKTNYDPDNLLLVHRRDVCRFNHMRLKQGPDGITEAGVLVAQISNRIAETKRRSKR